MWPGRLHHWAQMDIMTRRMVQTNLSLVRKSRRWSWGAQPHCVMATATVPLLPVQFGQAPVQMSKRPPHKSR